MPNYKCQILDNIGSKKTIYLEASDDLTLKAKIKSENYILLKYTISKEKKVNTFLAVRSKVKRGELITFFRQFSVMVKASIPISAALKTLKGQKYSKALQNVLNKVYEDVESGVLLSEAFGKHPKVFPNFYGRYWVIMVIAISAAASVSGFASVET